MQTIGERIRELRGGMSLKELERLSGIDRTTLSKLENNKWTPGVGTLERLAKALGVEASDLLKRQSLDDLVKSGAVKVLHFPQPQTEEEEDYVYKLLKILRSDRERFKKSIKGLLDDFAEIEAEERQVKAHNKR